MSIKGAAATFTGYSFQVTNYTEGVALFVQNGYNFQRSGDVALILEPGWFESKTKEGTTHGSSYSYDTHVPLLWYGTNIKAGSTATPVEITDIAPTIATMLNISFPNGCTGKPISELVK